MKTPEEIKKALEICGRGLPPCDHDNKECCYRTRISCSIFLARDALEYIKQLESKLAEYEKPLEPMAHASYGFLGPHLGSLYANHGTCSNCKERILIDTRHENFCPNCGAKMDLKEED